MTMVAVQETAAKQQLNQHCSPAPWPWFFIPVKVLRHSFAGACPAHSPQGVHRKCKNEFSPYLVASPVGFIVLA
jgi:hypothetical protein